MFKLKHCREEFESYDTQPLNDSVLFDRRLIVMGKCPICGKEIVVLFERRKADKLDFESDYYINKAATAFLDFHRHDFVKEVHQAHELISLTYGVHKYIKNNKGKIIAFRQRAYDFYSNNKILKDIAV